MATGKIAALDVGTVRVGVALSDESGKMSFPHSTVHLKECLDPIHEIGELLNANGVSLVVVGLPLGLDGSEGPAVKRTRQFVARLKAAYPKFRYVPQDERMTSVAAENALVELSTRGSEKKESVDAIAAHFILQTYLSRRNAL